VVTGDLRSGRSAVGRPAPNTLAFLMERWSPTPPPDPTKGLTIPQAGRPAAGQLARSETRAEPEAITDSGAHSFEGIPPMERVLTVAASRRLSRWIGKIEF